VSAADGSDIDIHVRRGSLYSVSGVAFDSAGVPLGNGSVALGRLSVHAAVFSVVPLADGKFTVRGLQPGEYVIRAEANSSNEPSNANAYEMGLVRVTIDRANLTGVAVRTAKAAAVSGRVEFLEGAPPRKPIININTRLANGAATAITGRFLPPARMQQDLSFRLDGLLGPRALQVFGSMRPWVVKAIQYRGRDIFGEFVDFSSTGDANDVVVMLTNRGASVSGRVQIDASVNSEDLAVVLIPRQSTGAKALLPGAIVTSSVVDGQYQLPLVRAGEYLVAAIALSDVPPAGAVTMPGAFDRLARVAQPIQLGERQDLRLDLKVVRPGSN
jgi:hypothetical protein